MIRTSSVDTSLGERVGRPRGAEDERAGGIHGGHQQSRGSPIPDCLTGCGRDHGGCCHADEKRAAWL